MKHLKRDPLFWIPSIVLGVLTAVASSFAQPSTVTSLPAVPRTDQPAAAVREVVDDYFGTKITDPYRWMEEPNSAELSEWMRAQNAYSRSQLDRSPLRERFLNRIDALSNPDVVITSLKKVGNLYFYLKIAPGDTDRKLYFRYGQRGIERLLVDPGRMSESGKRYSIISYSPSQDGSRVSYLISAGGAELGDIRVVDTSTGKDLGEKVGNARWGAGEWLPDNDSFLYVRFPVLAGDSPQTEKFQKRRVYLHKVGDSAENDREVFGWNVNPEIDIDPRLLPFPTVPLGSKHAFVVVNTGVSPNSEIYAAPLQDLARPVVPWRKVVTFEDEVSAFVHSQNDLYLLTYKNAPRFKIVKTNLANPEMHRASIVVPESEAIVTGMTLGADVLIVQKSSAGIGKLSHVDLKRGEMHDIELPIDASISGLTSDPQSKEILFTAVSWIRPSAIYSYDPKIKKAVDTLLQPSTNIKTSDFESIQVKAEAADGTMIPLSIIYKKGLKLDGQNRTVLSGYGSYGRSQSPFFLPAFLAWMEQGGIVAFAHVRGGGEYGREWHLGGFRKNKPNTWNDFIACAEYLVRERYTSPEMLAAHGASAGGILVGNAIATRPDLFGAAVIQVGLNNMLRYETTPNGVPNIAEFGSVKNEEGFRTLLEMDAYHKIVKGGEYPAVILTHGINDPRVEPWFSAKLAARLQAATSSNRPVLLRIDYDAGHGIGSSRKQSNAESADVMTFLAEQLR